VAVSYYNELDEIAARYDLGSDDEDESLPGSETPLRPGEDRDMLSELSDDTYEDSDDDVAPGLPNIDQVMGANVEDDYFAAAGGGGVGLRFRVCKYEGDSCSISYDDLPCGPIIVHKHHGEVPRPDSPHDEAIGGGAPADAPDDPHGNPEGHEGPLADPIAIGFIAHNKDESIWRHFRGVFGYGTIHNDAPPRGRFRSGFLQRNFLPKGLQRPSLLDDFNHNSYDVVEFDQRIVDFCLSRFGGSKVTSQRVTYNWIPVVTDEFPNVPHHMVRSSIRYAYQQLYMEYSRDRLYYIPVGDAPPTMRLPN